MEQKNLRVCKRCLLKDFAPEEYIANMRIYLDGLDEEMKTADALYRDRLRSCEACENLNEGICRLCGCFVEYRAAINYKKCPAVHQLDSLPICWGFSRAAGRYDEAHSSKQGDAGRSNHVALCFGARRAHSYR